MVRQALSLVEPEPPGTWLTRLLCSRRSPSPGSSSKRLFGCVLLVVAQSCDGPLIPCPCSRSLVPHDPFHAPLLPCSLSLSLYFPSSELARPTLVCVGVFCHVALLKVLPSSSASELHERRLVSFLLVLARAFARPVLTARRHLFPLARCPKRAGGSLVRIARSRFASKIANEREVNHFLRRLGELVSLRRSLSVALRSPHGREIESPAVWSTR